MFEITAEKADERCSTFLLSHCGKRCRLPLSRRGGGFCRGVFDGRQKNSSWGIAISTLMTHIGGILGPLIAWFNVDEVTNVASCGSQILGELWSHSRGVPWYDWALIAVTILTVLAFPRLLLVFAYHL